MHQLIVRAHDAPKKEKRFDKQGMLHGSFMWKTDTFK